MSIWTSGFSTVIKINTALDSYFQGKSISAKTPLGFEICQKIMDIDICREMNIPFAESIEDLPISDYRFLSLYLQKERFWKNQKGKK